MKCYNIFFDVIGDETAARRRRDNIDRQEREQQTMVINGQMRDFLHRREREQQPISFEPQQTMVINGQIHRWIPDEGYLTTGIRYPHY